MSTYVDVKRGAASPSMIHVVMTGSVAPLRPVVVDLWSAGRGLPS
jgi:hypothetical protein